MKKYEILEITVLFVQEDVITASRYETNNEFDDVIVDFGGNA